MDNILSFLTKDLVDKAVLEIDKNGVPKNRQGTGYAISINNNEYPFKLLITEAAILANVQVTPNDFSSNANNRMGFKELTGYSVINLKTNPVQRLVNKYKAHIEKGGLDEEIYKWHLLNQYQGRPNNDAADFYKEIKDTNFANLIYPVGIGAINHIAKDATEPYRACFKILFDESKPIIERVDYFNSETLKIYRTLVPEKRFSHHQDERTMATFLTYHNPEKYTFYKNSFYKKYCDLINIKSKKKGEKYVHYLELIDDFINEYILQDQELIDLFHSRLPENVFQDKNFKILAQDILYQGLDKHFGDRKKYWRIGTSGSEKSYWEFMKANTKVCIGWSEIGDLNDAEIKSKKDVQKLVEDKEFYPNDSRTSSRKAGEIFNFYKNVNVGDIVLAQDGSEVLGIGIVNDEYIFDASDDFAHQKLVDWKIFNPKFSNDVGLRTTVVELNKINLRNQINDLLANLNSLSIKYSFEQMAKMFQEYLIKVIPKSASNYVSAITTINRIGIESGSLKETLYEVQDLSSYNTLISKLEKDEEYIERNTVGHSMFSSSLKKYKGFLGTLQNRTQIKQKSNNMDMPLNQILFGPPGTGKTYNTINKAIEIINPDFDLQQERKEVITEFDRLLKEKSIVFTTFHQSMSYEDFIEGIKPVTESGKVTYEVIPGIFKNICETAASQVSPNFESAYETLIKKIAEHGDYFNLHTTSSAKSSFWVMVNTNGNLSLYTTANKNYQGSMTKENFQKRINGENVFRGWEGYAEGVIDYMKKECGFIPNSEHIDNTNKKYVLIIDEINRGNVSQIFGELITLIEEDKRLGNDESLEVTLPYSKESFGVPPNLYIIGTMNTADRSVEALDTALRRRFSFEEMPPDYSLTQLDYSVYNYKAFQLLKTINNRIEKLLDKDHTIGHSYFMVTEGKNEEKELLKSFYKNIIPLLQEYFFGDFGKIGLVLGKGFVNKKAWDKSTDTFADFDYESSDFEERDIYEIIDYRDSDYNINTIDMTFEKAIQLLMRGSIE